MSDDLVAGPKTGGWGHPNPIKNYCTGKTEYGGLVWYGENPPTAADFQAVLNKYGDVKIDAPTCLGLPSHYYRCKDQPCYVPPTVVL